MTAVSTTVAGCTPGGLFGTCAQQASVSCPAGTAITGCTAVPSFICPDGSNGTSGAFISGNTCTATFYNATELGTCAPAIISVNVYAQCINVP